MMIHNIERVMQILKVDLDTLTKREVNELRNEICQFLRWWAIIPFHELQYLGMIGYFQDMLNRRDEMLLILKRQ